MSHPQAKNLCISFQYVKHGTYISNLYGTYTYSSHPRCSVQEVFIKTLLSSQENTCVRVESLFLIKLQAILQNTSG